MINSSIQPKAASRRYLQAGLCSAMLLLSACGGDDDDDKNNKVNYQVWASDQSNSVAGVDAAGTRGSFLWIWDSADVEAQIAGNSDAAPIACVPAPEGGGAAVSGPCDLLDVFPQTLAEVNADGNATGNTLADLTGFGRLHGVLADPDNRYVTANIFAPGGGYVGVIDTRTREAVSLFRVTGTNVGGGTDVRSVHMSYWTTDGASILIANLNGKLMERIDVTRDSDGTITDIVFNRSASLGVGKNMQVTVSATAFSGNNAYGRPLIGRVGGDYAQADFNDLTPAGVCKENGCNGADGALGGRPNNVIICPIAATGSTGYITMGGGGLLVANTSTTPMSIVGEYGNQAINAAGCGGVQVDDKVWLNAGVSASGAGATQSVFTVYTLNNSDFSNGSNAQNTPMPMTVFKDDSNTATGGNQSGDASNDGGQLPGPDGTSRRDSHGMAGTLNGSHVHTVDRLANVVEVFDRDFNRSTYDLTSADGRGNGDGPCLARSISDDSGLPGNDPAPDLIDITPDGKYMVVAFRGPAPVSVNHSAQGSCPGVGIVEITDGGAYGRLVTVLNTRNTVDTSASNAPGGYPYSGAERSDVHGAIAIRLP